MEKKGIFFILALAVFAFSPVTLADNMPQATPPMEQQPNISSMPNSQSKIIDQNGNLKIVQPGSTVQPKNNPVHQNAPAAPENDTPVGGEQKKSRPLLDPSIRGNVPAPGTIPTPAQGNAPVSQQLQN